MAKPKKRPNKKDYVVLKKPNPFKVAGVTRVDYKDVSFLRQFVSDRGKIRSRKITGLTVQQQKEIAAAIKNAREMALLPYVVNKPTKFGGRRRSY